MTAHAGGLLLRVMHLLAGHQHRVVYWVGCYSQSSVQAVAHITRAGCAVVRLAPHSARIWW